MSCMRSMPLMIWLNVMANVSRFRRLDRNTMLMIMKNR